MSKPFDPLNAQKYPAEAYAEKFDVHVKTILRAVLGVPNPSDWAPDDLPLGKVADAFDMKVGTLAKVMRGQLQMIDAEHAAIKQLGISIRRFHQKRAQKADWLVPCAKHGRIVRYLLSDVAILKNDL